jgi:hypothetical protein
LVKCITLKIRIELPARSLRMLTPGAALLRSLTPKARIGEIARFWIEDPNLDRAFAGSTELCANRVPESDFRGKELTDRSAPGV